MADSTIVFDIQAKVDEAVSQLSKVNTTLEKTNKAVFQGVAAWDILKGALNLASKAFDGIVSVMSDAIVEASSAQDELNNLNQALALNGQYSKKASAELLSFADQIEATTKFSQGQIVSQLALAQTYGKSTGETKKLVQAATELSAATGMDLNSAVDALGKTYTGTGGALAKQVPILKGLTEAQLKNGDAVDIILKRFGGSAQAQVNTFSGALAQNKNTFDNLLETLGTMIVNNPHIIAAIKNLSAFFRSLEKIVSDNKESINEFISSIARMVSNIFPYLIRGIAQIIRLWGEFTKVVQYAAAAVSWAIAKVQNLVGGSTYLGQLDFSDAVSGIDDMTKAYEEQAKAIDEVADSLQTVVDKNNEVATVQAEVGTVLPSPINGGNPSNLVPPTQNPFTTPDAINGFVAQLTQGAEGAAKALSSAAGMLTNIFLPGFGGAVTSIVDLLSQSPEKVRETIKAFFDALPVILETIISNLDDLIIAFAKGMISAGPKLISAMVKEMPKAARALIKELPSIAFELVKSLAEAMFEMIKNLFSSGDSGIPIIGGVVDVVGGFLGGIGDFLGFADGGTISGQVPSGYQNDTFPAMLTSGETVIDRNLTARLDNFLSKSSSSNSNQGTAIINIKIGEEQMANVLVNLNRQGFRTA